ncbi:AAA family ATPase [Streptomyces sp. NPDC017988]|uniref:AAA family ATPase n=1 Tax=Streptomyces sp. NPDC017988 TaxID=3365025 RepID=UPI0037A4680F
MRIPSLLDLDSEQLKVVDLPFHGSFVVTGTPGTGKTVMAVYRAWALATAGRDVTLLTRFNLLHQYLAQKAPTLTEALSVTTYHRWLRRFWQAAFQKEPPQTDEGGWNYDWVEMQRECVLRKVRSTAHLVIDEGQNLPVAFYQLCRVLGLGVTVFADENEFIGDDQSTVAEIGRALPTGDGPLALRQNHRNTQEIAMLASEFCQGIGEGVSFSGRTGRTPDVLKIPSLEHLITGVSQYFNANPERSIGIICRSTRLLRNIQSNLSDLGLSEHTQAYVYDDPHRNTFDYSRRPIRIVSAASMKGLEFDSVFVPDLDAYTEDPTSVAARLQFFVLCTRAREDLYFAHCGAQEPAMVASIPESLLRRHVG